jgi:hypothetical protein
LLRASVGGTADVLLLARNFSNVLDYSNGEEIAQRGSALDRRFSFITIGTGQQSELGSGVSDINAPFCPNNIS